MILEDESVWQQWESNPLFEGYDALRGRIKQLRSTLLQTPTSSLASRWDRVIDRIRTGDVYRVGFDPQSNAIDRSATITMFSYLRARALLYDNEDLL